MIWQAVKRGSVVGGYLLAVIAIACWILVLAADHVWLRTVVGQGASEFLKAAQVKLAMVSILAAIAVGFILLTYWQILSARREKELWEEVLYLTRHHNRYKNAHELLVAHSAALLLVVISVLLCGYVFSSL